MIFDVSIIIPAYNEGDSIKRTLDQITQFLNQQTFPFEIIVVNDGSTDKTGEIVENYPGVNLISFDKNQGKGAAVKAGVMAAKNNYILFMDADHAIPIQYLLEFKEIDTDIVIGSKYLNQTENYPLYRRVVGKVFSFLKYIITGLNIKDTQCGFKFFKRDVAKKLFGMSQITGWCFDVEILLLAKKLNYAVKEMPIKLSDINAPSQISLLNSGTQMFMDLLKLRLKFKRGDYEL